ncbi:hypothetical protein EG328_009798 [Venturia inaequalis]|uniref:Uncharacterized protein n=2 Tax=Venturia inaequalis TaxID=5025 RepID=A0A8H3U931_VENIN|nr:hypothetical protein EG328_009798 [Venturia inaequalis]RDI77517.1 hypothetical protein Vi05172_g12528 [Venturia inaequalis]
MSNIIHHLPKNTTLAKAIIESFEIAEATCSIPTVFSSADKLPGTHITFHELMTILSVVPTVSCVLISVYLITGHYLHWVHPKEQKQIVLCIAYLPFFCIANFFCLYFETSASYITPVLSIYTAKGMVAVFLMYIAYLCPEDSSREHFHAGLERRDYYGKVRHDKGSLRWFRIIWCMVFQIIPVTLILFPTMYIIISTICPLDSRLEGAEMAMAGINFLTATITFSAIYIYYNRTKAQLKNHRGARKLNAFQSLVGLQSIQSLVFPLCTQSSSYLPTKYVSYEDFSNAIPAFMTCWESLVFAVLFIQVFSFTPYRTAVIHQHEMPATVQRAIVDTISQMDIVKGLVYMFQILCQKADQADTKNAKKLYKSKDGQSHELEPQRITSVNDELLQKLNSDEAMA